MHQETISKTVVLLLALGISALFLAMIQPFLMALFLAGVFIGPVIGSLLVSIWELYGVEFADSLPTVERTMDGPAESPPVTAPAAPRRSA